VVGENITCNSTFNPIPVFESTFPSSTVTNFMYESLAYSAVTDTLVTCGGVTSAQASKKLFTGGKQILFANSFSAFTEIRNIMQVPAA
jgi:hypothetical protein